MSTPLGVECLPPPLPSASSPIVLPVTERQESLNDESGDVAAQAFAGGLVEPEMLSAEDPAERRLVRGVPERAERALHPGQHLGRDAEIKGITTEKGREHARSGRADDAV